MAQRLHFKLWMVLAAGLCLPLAACGDDDDGATTGETDGVTTAGTDTGTGTTVTDTGTGETAGATDTTDTADATNATDTAATTDGETTAPAALAFANAPDESSPLYPGFVDYVYNTWGLELTGFLPPREFLVALMQTQPDQFGNQFEQYGFIARPDSDLPLGLESGSVDSGRVWQTCALCHAQKLPDGQVFVGLPSVDLDMSRFRADVNDAWVAAGNEPFMTDADAARLRAHGPGRIGAEPDGYAKAVPVDFPPYFVLGQRSTLNYLGTGQDIRSEAYLSIFGAGAGFPDDKTAPVPFPTDGELANLVSFLGQIEAPLAPAGLDPGKVAAGRAVFESASCNTCHHVDNIALAEWTTVDSATDGRERLPGADPAFPRGSIRTSFLHAEFVTGDDSTGGFDGGFAPYVQFIIKKKLKVRQTDGYRNATLRGLAYTAPYLHNGTVPTLEDLLKPAAERPKVWNRGEFVVDTTVPGNENRGHEWGTDLPEADKQALVEFLKSL